MAPEDDGFYSYQYNVATNIHSNVGVQNDKLGVYWSTATSAIHSLHFISLINILIIGAF